MDRRKLRGIDPESFAGRMAGARSLRDAQDDGFQAVDRKEILDLPLVIVAWETTDEGRGRRWSEVWALCQYNEGDVRKIKFQDGGRSADSVTRTLQSLAENGVTSDVVALLRGEEYSFTTDEGEAKTAMRYTLEDVDVEQDEPAF